MNRTLTTEAEADRHHDRPHPKRQLRVAAMAELRETGRIWNDIWMHAGSKGPTVLYKLKKDEWAKPSKVARMIGDLGVEASLQGFRYTEVMKEAMTAAPYHFLGGTVYIFKKAKTEPLTQLFLEAIDPKGRFVAAIFSDDMLLAIRHRGKVERWNIDISKCDKSHSAAMFEQLILLSGNNSDGIRSCIDQCTLPIRVESVANHSNKVYLKPEGPILYSGSTLTTVLNNVASFHIMHSIVRGYDGTKQGVLIAAEKVGYLVSADYCDIIEDMQFLKYSPVLASTGKYRAVLNFGVLLRASGYCRRDLPGRGPIEKRARDFQAGLLRSTYPCVSFPILEAMRKTAKGSADKYSIHTDKLLEYKVDHDEELFSVTNEDLLRRYRLTPEEYSHVLSLGELDYGYVTTAAGVLKILTVDYGLGPHDPDKELPHPSHFR